MFVSLNTTIGIYQEGSAEKAAEALKNMLSADAVLVRDGKEVKVPAKEVVPGDVVVLNTGDRVPGDIRMLEVNNLASQEAALTGESVPID
jgi:P-type E1-E2 ATPase